MKFIKVVIKIFKTLLTVLLSVILTLNIINIVQVVVLGQNLPMILGFGNAVVNSGSMEPYIRPGDVVVIYKQDSYQTRDIVLYKANHYITHRIIEKTEGGYITQGDANNTPDKEIQERQIMGRVVLTLPKVGYAVDFIKSPFGMLIVIAVLFLMTELPVFVEKIRQRRKAS